MKSEKRFNEGWEVEISWIELSEKEAKDRVARLIKCLLEFDESFELAEDTRTLSEVEAA